MHKHCNTVLRVFSLQPSEVADEYIEGYGMDEDHNYNLEIDDDYVASCGDIVLVKIGYDSEKKPLYNFLVGDGARPLKDLGYIVPPNTVPTYAIGEVEEPMCMREMMSKGMSFNDNVENISNEEVCDHFCLYDDEEEEDYDETDEDIEVVKSNEDGSYVVKEKRDDDGNLIMQSIDVKFQ